MLRRSTRQRTPPDRLKANEWNYRESISPERSRRIRNCQGNKCACGCGRPIDRYNSEIDHIEELADGGSNARSNLQALHKICHRIKTNRSAKLRAERKKWLEEYPSFMIYKSANELPMSCRYIKSYECENLPDSLLNMEVYKRFIGYGMCNGFVTEQQNKASVDKYIVTWHDGTTSHMKYSDIIKHIVVWD